jgi:hypothetical protein
MRNVEYEWNRSSEKHRTEMFITVWKAKVINAIK